MAALSLKARLLEPSTASVVMANNGLKQRSKQPAIGVELYFTPKMNRCASLVLFLHDRKGAHKPIS